MSEVEPLTRPAVERRPEPFTKTISTRIWQELPSEKNPYLTEHSRCHGYDLFELMEKRSFVEVLFLIFRGELPSIEQKQLLDTLMISCINPGPRHPATRAAMNAGVGKTDPSHILPISLSILGGEYLGAAEVESAMRWLRKNSRRDPGQIAQDAIKDLRHKEEPDRTDIHIVPGFGSRFNGIELMPEKIAEHLLQLSGASKTLEWGHQFALAIQPQQLGWLTTGLVAAVFCDLGFQPRMGPGLFQIISAPGLFAHGVEMSSRALTDMPFLDDENYFIENENAEEEQTGVEASSS